MWFEAGDAIVGILETIRNAHICQNPPRHSHHSADVHDSNKAYLRVVKQDGEAE
jgi:hypothetical protein